MEARLADIDFTTLIKPNYFPSPTHWEDEVLYFLMADRFSDGKETNYLDNQGQLVSSGTTPLFQAGDAGSATATPQDEAAWKEAGAAFVGGTISGITSKLGYLQRLGITAIWISPIFKQVASQQTYHGYGIQNFLDVDPRFGTRQELVDLVAVAHSLGIRVILDIILNHSGDVFAYDPDSARCPGGDHCWQMHAEHRYPVLGFRDIAGDPTLPFGPVDPGLFPDAAI